MAREDDRGKQGRVDRAAAGGSVLKRRHIVNFQEVANVTEHGDCSGDSDVYPQGDAHFALLAMR